MAEKVRPALVVSGDYRDLDRTLVTIVPHTTTLRGSQYEIIVNVTFLKPGAFLVQSVATYPNVRAIRKIGVLNREQFDLVFAGLLRWLGHTAGRTPVQKTIGSLAKIVLPRIGRVTFTYAANLDLLRGLTTIESVTYKQHVKIRPHKYMLCGQPAYFSIASAENFGEA